MHLLQGAFLSSDNTVLKCPDKIIEGLHGSFFSLSLPMVAPFTKPCVLCMTSVGVWHVCVPANTGVHMIWYMSRSQNHECVCSPCPFWVRQSLFVFCGIGQEMRSRHTGVWDAPASASGLSVCVQGLQMQATTSSFPWVLRITTQVLTLA